jgi:16S rRNA (guanine966-N2)-methyltransferase
LRIIAGEFKGRRIVAAKGRSIRPTADRLRETIFNILGNCVIGSRILDLFAGTGAMGIEALSRGADYAVFIDRQPAAIQCIQRNLTPLNIDHRHRVIRWDIQHSLACLAEDSNGFDIVFIDPPYQAGLIKPTLAHLDQTALLHEGCRIVIEHHRSETIACVPNRFTLRDQRLYGKALVSFLTAVL